MVMQLERTLERTLAILPVTKDDLLMRGIAGQVTERIVELRKVVANLKEKYGSLSALEERIKREGVPIDDHTLDRKSVV